MNESRYNQLLDHLMLAIEDAIEESGADIDYETTGGILTLTCENGSKLILSRQTPLRQLWLAAKSGGFHFSYDEESDQWLCDSTQELFPELLNSCLSEQSGEAIALAI
ncbi:iron donor protein CyaY [Endozoicomonas sp. Mp262]|uniref:iron donor protein CyaY n=1 Tax=Endozoicomonas sp. Mp262 TaxID=2919499 RepID=UPI0021DA3D2A